MLLLAVKYIHILAAIVAVGLNISYAVWIIRAQRDPTHTAFALKGIKFIDDVPSRGLSPKFSWRRMRRLEMERQVTAGVNPALSPR